MLDMTHTIIAKSTQLNSDDLVGGPITVQITKVSGTNDKEQPIAISYAGDNGKPYMPGKSMRRVLVNFWGKDGEAYVGRWLTLYRDPEVTFGKIKVGGIRISHMSHIDGGEMALAVTKGAKRLFTVKPLRSPESNSSGGEQRPKQTVAQQVDAYIATVKTLESALDVAEYQDEERRKKWLTGVRDKAPDEAARIDAAVDERLAELASDIGGRSDEQHGDQHPGDDDDTFPGGE